MTSTGKPDYWSLLGILPTSDSDKLKIAFRREARRWHPDLNINDKNAEERFKLVNEAYAVLSDPRKRSFWEDTNNYQSNTVQDPFENGFPDFEEYFNTVFEEGNLDHSYNEVDIEEHFDEVISSPEEITCPTPSSPSPPPVKALEDLESLVVLTPEQALYGTPVQIELEDGTVVEVNTPPLAGDGWRLRLAGVAVGGRDHFLQLRVQTEDGLRVDGLRVLYRLELFPQDAVLGCAVEVPTINGIVTLQVPPGSSSGRLLRLRGRGLELDGRKGDQLVEIVIVVPSQLDESERALYERIQELSYKTD